MIEIPESQTLASQVEKTLKGKTVISAIANASPHRFAWYSGDPEPYGERLSARKINGAIAKGSFVRISFGTQTLLAGDGVSLRFYYPKEKKPTKHQLCLVFDDESALIATIQMYGGLWLFENDDFDNPYYRNACARPAPLSKNFTERIFRALPAHPLNIEGTANKKTETLTAKTFLATEQRIPGLGNSVLQDNLWNAKINPKTKLSLFTDEDWKNLYAAVVATLLKMTDRGGRDTERDLFGIPGGYTTIASKNTVRTPCPRCGTTIKKESYMGGCVYFCPCCQDNN